MPKDGYFATWDADAMVGELRDRVSQWANFINRNGLQAKWWKSYRLYYGKQFFSDQTFNFGSSIARTGDKGELSAFGVNFYASFLKHIHVMATAQNPAFDARAVNSDSESLQQAKLANNILDAYMREKKLGLYLSRAAEQALIFGKGFIFAQWDPSLGEKPVGVSYAKDESGQPILSDDGQPKEKLVYEGDIDIQSPSVFDVFVDQSCEDWNKIQWANIRCFKNKWDLCEQYPDKAEQIKGLDTKAELDGIRAFTFQQFDLTSDVPVYYFFHKPTRSLKNGRLTIWAGRDVVLYDGPNPYDVVPLFRIVPGEIFGTTEGYTVGFDLQPLQDAYNVLVSSAYTNNEANAVQKIWVPEGGNITATQVSKGLAILRGPVGAEPKPLQFTATAPETYQFLPMIEKMMEMLTGINSVIRGNPESSLKSGVALSLVQSMAVQYQSGYQQQWVKLLEDVGTFIIILLQKFASTERMVAMAGKHYKGYMQSFKGEDLKNIQRVLVDVGNPMARTVAGRFDIAKMLLDNGLLKQPQDLITVLETGQLDRATEGPEKRADLVQSENERLADGKPVEAMVGDPHLYHMAEHMWVAADPELRARASEGEPMANQIIQGVTAHVMKHMELYMMQGPMWSMTAGEPPAPQASPPPPMHDAAAPPPPGPQPAQPQTM